MPCIECRTKKIHKLSCNSTYTFPPYGEVDDNLFVGWLGARCLPEWKAVLSIIPPLGLRHEQQSYRCAGKLNGILPDATPMFLIDHHDQDLGLTGYFDRAFDFVDKHIKKGPVYFHCQAGISRSPFAAAVYLAARRDWSYEEALKTVRERRPVASIWAPFIEEGKQYLRYVRAVKRGEIPAGSYIAPSRAGWRR